MALFWVHNRTEFTDDCYNAFIKTDEHGRNVNSEGNGEKKVKKISPFGRRQKRKNKTTQRLILKMKAKHCTALQSEMLKWKRE